MYGIIMSPIEENRLVLNKLLFSSVLCFSFLFRSGSWRAHWWTWTTRPSGTTTALLSLSITVWWSPLSCHALGKEVCTVLWQCCYTIGNYDLFLRIYMEEYQSPSLILVILSFHFVLFFSILSTRWNWIEASEDRGFDNFSWEAYDFGCLNT